MNEWAIRTKATIADALLIASAEFAVGLLVCYLILTVRFFRRRETTVGLLCSACLVLGGGGLVLGVPVALLFG